ncbi:MAG: tRNA (adenosine(37)-N6)-threonylcarbamoyltransferase complex ATPase subunit type 1 TsaE [Sphingobacteriales bacterium]|nr:MAG: tRNA (adenosine(37)-N6)-threonylcarbamoyltransferase complex ATPase subunit type 1 TsaE [Sphingobacteriales bacterium]TAF79462.1 MAG: tRNA (adenosine(37)-N6)-threonylcarbamoyltransferase complex ATPase subunit type 1 TsaE [Sphingobacteriales bacterium]
MQYFIESESQLPKAAHWLLQHNQKVFMFYGQMGAGKTTLITHICKQLGVQGHISSPTFAIVNQYLGSKNIIYHFDFYRIKNQQEALDLGYEEYLYSDAYCLVEWPNKIPDLLPQNYLKVEVEILDNYQRKLTVKDVTSKHL